MRNGDGLFRHGQTVHVLRDPKRLRQFSRPRAKIGNVIGVAPQFHQVDTVGGFDGADQNRRTRCANDIGAPVQSVGSVDIEVSVEPEHRPVASGRSIETVRCRIVGTIGLGFDDDPARIVHAKCAANQVFGDRHGVSQIITLRKEVHAGSRVREQHGESAVMV